MNHIAPLEISIFESFLKRVLEPKGDGRPAIFALGEELAEAATVTPEESIPLLFRQIETLNRLIDELTAGQRQTRAGGRLKERIATLCTPEMLSRPYNEYQKIQRQNVEAIIDLMAFLEHLEFDNEKFDLARPDIDQELSEISAKVAQSSDLSEAQQRIVIAQVNLIKNSLSRFKTGGVTAFRDSISCGIGRLHIVLKTANEKQAIAVRDLIDDFLRVKDVAEAAGGAFALTGPYIAGLLTGPALG